METINGNLNEENETDLENAKSNNPNMRNTDLRESSLNIWPQL